MTYIMKQLVLEVSENWLRSEIHISMFHSFPHLNHFLKIRVYLSKLNSVPCVFAVMALEDICDCELYKRHPLLSTNPLALQIIMFYDELEVCNPLGTPC